MMQEIIPLPTPKKREILGISEQINEAIKSPKFEEGSCNIFAMHSTAAIIINEDYSSGNW